MPSQFVSSFQYYHRRDSLHRFDSFFQCATCPQPIKVLYEDPTLLVLGSDYIDVIWKGVARAQTEGYQIDSMTSYVVSNAGSSGRTVNLLVAMSK